MVFQYVNLLPIVSVVSHLCLHLFSFFLPCLNFLCLLEALLSFVLLVILLNFLSFGLHIHGLCCFQHHWSTLTDSSSTFYSLKSHSWYKQLTGKTLNSIYLIFDHHNLNQVFIEQHLNTWKLYTHSCFCLFNILKHCNLPFCTVSFLTIKSDLSCLTQLKVVILDYNKSKILHCNVTSEHVE